VSRRLLPLLFFLAGCRGCGCGTRTPYVPPAVSSPVAVAEDAGAPVVEIDSGTTIIESALALPPGTTSWRAEGLEIEAGEGREITLALVRDFDGDGAKDALVVVRETTDAKTAGQLLYVSPGGATTVATGPPLSVDASCTPAARLEKIGPRSAFAEIGTTCTKGAGTRGLFVLRLGKGTPTVAFDASVVDPPASPKLAIDVDAADRDKDGNDDVVLKLTIEGGGAPFEPGPRLQGKLAFFDRPAGASRDAEEPEASLRAIASQAAKQKAVPPFVQQMRALFRAMCAEGGAPRLAKIHGGAPVACGSQKALEEAGLAEVRSFAKENDPLRAIAAADLAQLPPATKTAKTTTEIEAAITSVAPRNDAKNARTLAVEVDVPRAQHPEWGPLTFEANGKLLVRHGKTVSRVDPDSGDEEANVMPAWSAHVVSPDGKSRWLEAYHACEGVALRATFAPTGDGDMHDVLLPVAPRLGTKCAGGRGEAAPTIPIAWGPSGLETIVAGQPLLITLDPPQAKARPTPIAAPPMYGSPRSINARATAIATSRGILVRSDKTMLYRAPELEPYGELRHCTVNDDATRVACVRRGKVVVASF
jgi:hypothetical protein